MTVEFKYLQHENQLSSCALMINWIIKAMVSTLMTAESTFLILFAIHYNQNNSRFPPALTPKCIPGTLPILENIIIHHPFRNSIV